MRVVRELWELTVDEADEATASRGAKGVFAGAGRLLASVGFRGRGLLRSGRSMGILQGGAGYCVGSGRRMQRGLMALGAGKAMGGMRAKGGVDDGC